MDAMVWIVSIRLQFWTIFMIMILAFQRHPTAAFSPASRGWMAFGSAPLKSRRRFGSPTCLRSFSAGRTYGRTSHRNIVYPYSSSFVHCSAAGGRRSFCILGASPDSVIRLGGSDYRFTPTRLLSSVSGNDQTARVLNDYQNRTETTDSDTDSTSFFAPPNVTFASLGIQSPLLLQRLEALGLSRPTSVQAAVYPRIVANQPPAEAATTTSSTSSSQNTIILGAETGSGKTLAYLLPLLDDILQRKQRDNADLGYDYARTMILVPNKELVQQLIRMALPLTGGPRSLLYDGGNPAIKRLVQEESRRSSNTTTVDDEKEVVRLAIFPGGLDEPMDFPPFRATKGLTATGRDPPVDVLISTPASMGPLGRQPKHLDMFADIQTLIVDEADLLLDGGYIRQLENVLLGFKRADRLHDRFQADEDDNVDVRLNMTQHVFSAATLPDYGLRSVDAYLKKKFPNATRITIEGMHQASHSGLAHPTVWIQEDSKKGRMEHLVQLLKTPPSTNVLGAGGLQGQKVMIFLNSVDNVEGATDALARAGITNALAYHAKIKLEERTEILDRFRRYDSGSSKNDADACPILLCTDLASRGLDLPNVDCVVQLQFAGNVVAHLHRMGRCGRAGQQTGRGIVFYSEKEAELVKVVQEAEQEQKQMVLEGDVDMDIDENNEQQQQSSTPAGSVQKAFSRRRGFTRKRKKLRKEAAEASNEL